MPDRTPPDKARAERLADLKRAKGVLSQKGLADAMGVTVASVREWEKGARPNPTSIDRLAAYFGVNARWYDSGEGERNGHGDDLLTGLQRLQEQVTEQSRAIAELKTALAEDPRWPQVEERLNFLSEQMRRYAGEALDADEQGESRQWSPIDLTP